MTYFEPFEFHPSHRLLCNFTCFDSRLLNFFLSNWRNVNFDSCWKKSGQSEILPSNFIMQSHLQWITFEINPFFYLKNNNNSTSERKIISCDKISSRKSWGFCCCWNGTWKVSWNMDWIIIWNFTFFSLSLALATEVKVNSFRLMHLPVISLWYYSVVDINHTHWIHFMECWATQCNSKNNHQLRNATNEKLMVESLAIPFQSVC